MSRLQPRRDEGGRVMGDICTKLRAEADQHQTVFDDDRKRKMLLNEAADQIDQLEAERASLKEFVKSIATNVKQCNYTQARSDALVLLEEMEGL